MNWTKENPFLAGFIAISLLVVGGLGYYAYTNYTAYTELRSSYETEVGTLHTFQNRTPFPSKENLQKIIESQKSYHTALLGLRKSLEAHELPLNPKISPQQFQDELRRAVSLAQSKAAQARMALPPDFYLGFDVYSTSLPRPEATPYLDRELKVIEALFAGLIDAGVESLNQFVRTPLAVESGSAGKAAAPAKPGAGNNDAAGSKMVEKHLLDLTFTGEQGRVRLAVNSLLNSPQFAVVRALKFQNSSPQSPPKLLETALPNDPEPAPGRTASKALSMVFGREKITAQVRLELLSFEKIDPPRAEKS
ncbi:MAG TPA: Amuc_1100 family pilus-like protein, partial [Chthoniobacterales bacterium]